MDKQFNDLSTEKFRQKMQPAALAIYQRIFPGCTVEYLKGCSGKAHPLDKEFGIDCLIHIGDQWISVQEKYRENSAIHYLDFTQEFKNAEGTQYETKGEWFILGAQVYFYGWANNTGTGFEKWALIDIAKYKMIVNEAGGLGKIGTKRTNNLHGKASFYAIKIEKLKSAFITDYRKYLKQAA